MHQQQLKYGDKTHVIHSSPESYRCELYKSSGAGNHAGFEFAGLINHSLSVQKAEHVTAGVDSALQQLRSSMAAISEIKEANKYASPVFPRLSSNLPHREAIVVLPKLTRLLAGPLSATPRPHQHRATVASLRQASRRSTSLLPSSARPC